MTEKQFCGAHFKLSKNVLKSGSNATNNTARGRQSFLKKFFFGKITNFDTLSDRFVVAIFTLLICSK